MWALFLFGQSEGAEDVFRWTKQTPLVQLDLKLLEAQRDKTLSTTVNIQRLVAQIID